MMANLRPMIDHIARGLVAPLDWEQLSGPTKAVALAKATHLLADAPILYDALQNDKLRELLSYCEERMEYKGRDNEIGADTAYGDVADKLRGILDGE